MWIYLPISKYYLYFCYSLCSSAKPPVELAADGAMPVWVVYENVLDVASGVGGPSAWRSHASPAARLSDARDALHYSTENRRFLKDTKARRGFELTQG